jgi:glutamate 5-kinase
VTGTFVTDSAAAKKRLVLKIGSSTLTANTERISRGKIEDLARQIISLQNDADSPWQVVLVSSGAIAAARQFIAVNHWPPLASKQAMAAIGQPLLMQMYHEIFRDFGLRTAQCLLTYRDFNNPQARQNTQTTLNDLLAKGYVPVVNENDTVATDELVFGDNDKLSAYVAALLRADELVLASDVAGLYDCNPHKNPAARLIETIDDLAQARSCIDERQASLGTGGMTSKLQAAEICRQNGVKMRIVAGDENNFLHKALSGNLLHSQFPAVNETGKGTP